MSLLVNRNLLWARLFLAEWVGQGLQAACVASGSRSTPLALVLAEFAAHGLLKLYIHNDERSAAYFALGLARASRRPVAVVCTSGTAAANFHPAVIEADYAEVPLLILTADRPPELRESGANQTIDQVKLFGNAVRAYAELPLPEANPSPATLRAVRGLAARLWLSAQSPLPGPVQVNFPFRKPLEPLPVAGDVPAWLEESHPLLAPRPQVRFVFPRPQLDLAEVDWLLGRLERAERPLVVCGPRAVEAEMAEPLLRLAERFQLPILADGLSGLRLGYEHPLLFGAYDAWIGRLPAPDFVLRFGDVPTSAALSDYLDQDGVEQVYVAPFPRWRDDRFRLAHVLIAEGGQLLRLLNDQAQGRARPSPSWAEAVRALSSGWQQRLAAALSHPDCEASVLFHVLQNVPEDDAVMVASSLPVRHLDQFVPPLRRRLRVFANRGASGIDGVVSSGLGLAAHFGHATLVLGDLALYHDANGLLALKRHGLRATVVVINNDGGGIFHRLPIAEFEPPFRELFVTPHGLRFAPLAELYGLEYLFVEHPAALPQALARLDWTMPTLVEVRSDAEKFEQWRKNLWLSG